MKRSEINAHISEAKKIFDEHRFHLPVWAYWTPIEWKGKRLICSEIIDNGMGWDITDFGSGKFAEMGLTLFTIRNGNPHPDAKKYCEKIMVSKVGQVCPMHFHWKKTEDIINRAGGDLVMELYQASMDGKMTTQDVQISVDGVHHVLPSGTKLVLKPGQSVCLTPYIYHRFWAEGKPCMIGEVSSVNDDSGDNRFYEPIARFPEIDEDEIPIHLLVSDYKKFV